MADRAVGELPRISHFGRSDLLLVEQGGVAKAGTGQVLINDLAKELDGHGGIYDWRIVPGPGKLDFKLVLVLSDQTEVQVPMVNGKGIKSFVLDRHEKLTDIYKLTYTDDTTAEIRVTNGRGVQNFRKTDTQGLVDTYTIDINDGTTYTFQVENGKGIESIRKTESSGLTDTYTILYNNGESSTFQVENGKGIKSISKTATVGLIDTYTILYNDGTSSTFPVANGAKGDPGAATYTWIKFASRDPAKEPHSFGDAPDRWLGLYWGPSSSAPELWSDYHWYEIKGEKGDTGDPATVTQAKTEYQVSDSGTVVPIGPWTAEVPPVPQGNFLWVRQTLQFNTGKPLVSYNVTRYGMDGLGTANSVDGVQAEPGGNVPLGAWRQINGKTPGPDGSGKLTAADVGAATKENIVNASIDATSRVVLFESAESGESSVNVTTPSAGYIFASVSNGGRGAHLLQVSLSVGGLSINKYSGQAGPNDGTIMGPYKVPARATIRGILDANVAKNVWFYKEKV